MGNERGSISKKLRFEIFKRDAFTCQYCGAKPPAVVLQVDHIVPVAEGGVTEIPNLITACAGCNSGKGARPIDGLISRADTAAAAQDMEERKEQLQAFYQYQRELADVGKLNCEIVCEHFEHYHVRLSVRDEASIKTFLKHFSPVELMQFIDTAVSRRREDVFRYFCGIAWGTIKGRSEGRK